METVQLQLSILYMVKVRVSVWMGCLAHTCGKVAIERVATCRYSHVQSSSSSEHPFETSGRCPRKHRRRAVCLKAAMHPMGHIVTLLHAAMAATCSQVRVTLEIGFASSVASMRLNRVAGTFYAASDRTGCDTCVSVEESQGVDSVVWVDEEPAHANWMDYPGLPLQQDPHKRSN